MMMDASIARGCKFKNWKFLKLKQIISLLQVRHAKVNCPYCWHQKYKAETIVYLLQPFER